MYGFTSMRYLQESNSSRQKAKQMLPGTARRGNGELLFRGYRFTVGDDEKVWGIDNGDDYTTL